ncbi:hypothetical protein RHSIM_Rhsim13G0122400 [Rhododendron simsii]|uniref:Uncharacterized protein n=1 Tax=Rhododendron simsii TaxID=118357 RepID=A0A834G087_RHOSS|nr:hypothetical protein RHSIM_Rhsim13G0122400 [Rhododendron simsii]
MGSHLKRKDTVVERKRRGGREVDAEWLLGVNSVVRILDVVVQFYTKDGKSYGKRVPYAEGNNILCCTADDLRLATKLHHFLLGVPYGYLKGWKVTQIPNSGL